MPIDNLSKITSRSGISTTILLEAGNVNATGIITAAGFNGPFTGGGAISAGIITGTGLEISGISTLGIITASGNISIGATLDLSVTQVGFDNPSQIKLSDLVIGQHQNTGSYKIENGSTGSLLLRADMINFATSNGGTSLLRSSTNEVQIFAGNTARLVTNGIGATVFGELDVTGDVGIGTTNPHKRLHVADYGTHGAIRVEGSGNGNRSGIEFYRETSAGVSKGGAAIWVESDTSTSAGKLRFGTASNAAIQSQNTDMILDHQGRLGIGTTNPQQRLQVAGTILKTNTDSGIGIIYLTNDGSGNGNVLINDSSGVTRVKFDSADVSYIRGGNLGIGSMTPGRALTIQNSEPRIRLQKPNQGHGEIYIDDDNSINLSADSSSSVGTSSIIFRTNGAENVRIKEDKVGVGLSNPTETLTIDGSATDTAPILGLRSGNNHNAISDGAQIVFGHAGVNHYQHFIHTRHNASNTHNAIDFYVCDGTQQNTVTSGSVHTLSMVSGKVGIGSTNPTTDLDVRGNIIFQNNMLISNMDSNGVSGTNIDHIWHSDATDPKAGGTWNFVSDGSAKQVGNAVIQAGYLKTSSGGSLFGSVGIGTTDPAHKLHVQADNPTIALESNSTTGNTNIVFGDGGGETQGRIQYHNNGDYMRFYTSGDERLRIASDGTVGIGTDSPQVHLNVSNPTTLGGTTGNRQDIARFEGHVANDGMLEFANVRLTNGADWQTTTFRIQRRIDSTRMGYIDFGTGSGSGAGGAGRDIQFGSGEGRIMLQLDSAGSVGVGTAAPAVRLDVRNDSGTSADTEPLVALHHSVHDVDGEVLRIGRTDLPTIRYHSLFSEHSGGASSNTLKFYMHTGSAGASASSTRQVLTLQGNGRVGIGTTNGGLEAALEVCSDEGAFIKSFTNATPARVRFSDHASGGAYDQLMTIDYKHSNNQVVDGTAEGLHIFGSESSTAVRIDGLLRITEQPCAVVYQASGPAGGAIDGSSDDAEPIHFDHVHINQGGMAISDDNARITVPVPGNYLVSGMISGTVTTPNVNDGIELIFLVDGSEAISNNSRIEPVDNFGTTAGQSEYAFINTTILTLAENDFVELAVHSVGDADASVTRGHLSVALLN